MYDGDGLMKGEIGFGHVLVGIFILALILTHVLFTGLNTYTLSSEYGQTCLKVGDGVFTIKELPEKYTIIEMKDWSCDRLEYCIGESELNHYDLVYFRKCVDLK